MNGIEKRNWKLIKKKIDALEYETKNLREEMLGFNKVMKRENETPITPASHKTGMLKEKNQFDVLSTSSDDEGDTENCKQNTNPRLNQERFPEKRLSNAPILVKQQIT